MMTIRLRHPKNRFAGPPRLRKQFGLVLIALLLVVSTNALAAGPIPDAILIGWARTINDGENHFGYWSAEGRWALKPNRVYATVCLEGNSGERYLSMGLFLTLAELGNFRFGIGSGPGIMKNGAGILGSDLEFRSVAELQYRLNQRTFLGLDICHYSNAGIGSINPGAESIRAFICVRL